MCDSATWDTYTCKCDWKCHKSYMDFNFIWMWDMNLKSVNVVLKHSGSPLRCSSGGNRMILYLKPRFVYFLPHVWYGYGAAVNVRVIKLDFHSSSHILSQQHFYDRWKIIWETGVGNRAIIKRGDGRGGAEWDIWWNRCVSAHRWKTESDSAVMSAAGRSLCWLGVMRERSWD